jgi:hypothetical protein
LIGLDFPVKPEWIHDVHHLWRPEQPVSDLMALALSRTIQEVAGRESRRKSLTVILRYFVATEGGGQSRCTASQDVWVAYSQAYPASTLAPAYLGHLIAQNEVGQEASRFITRRHAPGDPLTSGELRRHVVARFGERKVVTNAVSAFLRTLQYFGVLSPGERLGEYHFATQLLVSREVFPLVVWAWWQAHLSPQIDLDDFAEDPALAFLESEGFAGHWAVYQPALWVLEERLDVRRVTLKYGEADTFGQALLGLLPPVP